MVANWRRAGGPCHPNGSRLLLFMCFFIGFPRIAFVCVRFRKNNHLARCLVSGVTDGRDNGRNNSAWLCWGLLVQVDQGCPRLRWAMVDHGSQLASSRRSLCQVQKLSYSCVSLSALDKTANPYCWYMQRSCLFVSVFEQQPSCSLLSFWGHERQGQQQEQ